MFKRPIYRSILKRLSEPRRFIQVLAGPRQTGKTTLARQLMEAFNGYAHYASADEPALKDNELDRAAVASLPDKAPFRRTYSEKPFNT